MWKKKLCSRFWLFSHFSFSQFFYTKLSLSEIVYLIFSFPYPTFLNSILLLLLFLSSFTHRDPSLSILLLRFNTWLSTHLCTKNEITFSVTSEMLWKIIILLKTPYTNWMKYLKVMMNLFNNLNELYIFKTFK